MSTEKTRFIAQSTHRTKELNFAHNRLINIHKIVTEDEWVELMLNYGERFALAFSLTFGNKAEKMASYIIGDPPKEGCPNNWFWMWWRYNWMQDDWVYITNKLQHLQYPTYRQYKCHLLHSELLEKSLLDVLESNHFFNNKTV